MVTSEQSLELNLPLTVLNVSDLSLMTSPNCESSAFTCWLLAETVSRSAIYGFTRIWLFLRLTIVTAQSSTEAEIYATDECTKFLLYLHHILNDLSLADKHMPPQTKVYNDNNAACVCWSHNLTTKGLRHIQIRENAVRELVQSNFIDHVHHIAGKVNLADLFMKEDKDASHFIAIHDLIMTPTLKRHIKTLWEISSLCTLMHFTSSTLHSIHLWYLFILSLWGGDKIKEGALLHPLRYEQSFNVE